MIRFRKGRKEWAIYFEIASFVDEYDKTGGGMILEPLEEEDKAEACSTLLVKDENTFKVNKVTWDMFNSILTLTASRSRSTSRPHKARRS